MEKFWTKNIVEALCIRMVGLSKDQVKNLILFGMKTLNINLTKIINIFLIIVFQTYLKGKYIAHALMLVLHSTIFLIPIKFLIDIKNICHTIIFQENF